MTDRVKVFWFADAPKVELELRRYVQSDKGKTCPQPWGHHNAGVVLGHIDEPVRGVGEFERATSEILQVPYPDTDPRWPARCACGYVFTPEDARQVNTTRLYSGAPDGKLYTLNNAPVGAMWDAWWSRSHGDDSWLGRTGFDGLRLIVQTPAGPWDVDSRASNCDMPDDDAHRCWVRHGDPRTGIVHVDKNGLTCNAGAGSILMHNGWHGFLHNGELYRC